MHKIIVLMVALFASACSGDISPSHLPYFTAGDLTPVFDTVNGQDISSYKKVGSFSLVGQNGELVTDMTVSNRPYVATFFFTECTGICPTLRTRLSVVQDRFDGNDLTMLSVSIASEDQDLSKLQAYSSINGIHPEVWKLVTGNATEIQDLALDSFGVRLDLNGNMYAHTETVYLVDAQGYIRGLYNGTLEVDMLQLLKDLDILVSENSDVS